MTHPKTLVLLAAVAATSALTTGCNFGRQPTAGEQMLDSSRTGADAPTATATPAPDVTPAPAPAPVVVAQADAPSGITVPSTGGAAQPSAATNPATHPALAVPPASARDVKANPPPSTIASASPTGPSTTPASTAPAERGPRLYVAADADEATRIRNWKPVVNYYPSGNVIAGPTYRIEAPPPRTNRPSDVYLMDLAQTFLTVPQSLATPFWMFVTPPNTPVEYHGEVYPPSYTVDDPLPYYQNEKVPGVLELTRPKPRQ